MIFFFLVYFWMGTKRKKGLIQGRDDNSKIKISKKKKKDKVLVERQEEIILARIWYGRNLGKWKMC